jgi:ATP synthase protein I
MESHTNTTDNNEFSKVIAAKEKRKQTALRENSGSIWSGLGMFGMVGWSVAVPTLAGAALGVWLDKKNHQSFSWTLTCLMIGLVAGSAIAWSWVNKEDQTMHQNKDENND